MLQMQEFEKILNEASEKVNFTEFEKVEAYLTVLQATPILSKQDIASLKEIYKRLKELEKLKNLYKKIVKHAKKELKRIGRKPVNAEQETEIQTLRQIIEKSNEAIESETQRRTDVMYRGVRNIFNRYHARFLNIINTSIYCLLAFAYLGCVISMPYRENHMVYIIPIIIFGIIGIAYVFIYLKFYFKHGLYSKKVKWIKYLTWLSVWLLIYTVALVGFFYVTKIESEILISLSSVLSLSLIIAANLLDFFSSTQFFDEKEVPLFTMVIVAIVAFMVSRLLDNEIVNYFINIFLAIASIILIFLIIKKFIVEMPNVSKPISIFNLIILILLTLVICVLTIYGFFWNNQENAAQDLFNAIMGVFAGIAGGALTLAGVAWTIKSGREKDRREEVLKCKPMFRYCDAQNENIPQDAQNFFFLDGEVAETQYNINKMCFKNFDNTYLIIESIIVNDILLKPLEIVSIEKGEYFCISYNLGAGRGVENFLLNIKDILGNPYRFELVRNKGGEIAGIREITEEVNNGHQ